MQNISQIDNGRVIAIDPSLTASGFAVFSLLTGQPLAIGVIKPLGPEELLSKRMANLQSSVEELFLKLKIGEPDVLVCEGPAPLVRNPDSSLKVERVRSIFESVARSRGATVPGRLNPRTVQSELLGMKGKQLCRKEVKEWAKATVERLWGDKLNKIPQYGRLPKIAFRLSQDEVDALLIGALAVTKIKRGWAINSSLEEIFDNRHNGLDLNRGRGRSAAGWRLQDVAKLQDKKL